MTATVVVIPVKAAGKKSRLAGVLDGPSREEFARLLLMGVLGELNKAGLLRSSRVVSPDREILGMAERAGARTVPESHAAGFDAAVARGLRGVQGRPDVLIIPADLPLLRAPELKHLLGARSDGLDVAIAPSRAFVGSNAMLFSLAARVPLRSRLRFSLPYSNGWQCESTSPGRRVPPLASITSHPRGASSSPPFDILAMTPSST